MRKISVVLLCLCFVLASSGLAEARSGRHRKGYGQGLYHKCYRDTKVILRNADELGLTDAQREAVRDHKYEMKRDKIRSKADIKLVSVDIAEQLRKEEVDMDAVNALIDQKYQLKAERQKDLVASRTAVTDVLNAEQKTRLKELRRETKGARYEKRSGREDKYMAGKKR